MDPCDVGPDVCSAAGLWLNDVIQFDAFIGSLSHQTCAETSGHCSDSDGNGIAGDATGWAVGR